MSGRKNIGILFGFVIAAGLIASSATAALMVNYYSRVQYQMVGDICGGIMKEQPDAEQTVLAVLKDYKRNLEEMSGAGVEGENVLHTYGYRPSDFLASGYKAGILPAAGGFLLFLFTFWLRNRREVVRIEALTDYLERVNTGSSGLLLQKEEDMFSKLQDEIYKTVTFAHQTKNSALAAKQNYAENLSNIAHQLKTPITAISLSAQMIKETSAKEYAAQIQMQLKRLTHLEEALLLLSRIDAGTLPLAPQAMDVFTILTLAADNLQEESSRLGVTLEVPEAGEVSAAADLDWTMEAVMNLMKNCMEHSPAGGTIHCSYDQNPLYTQIQIWDEGVGFAKEDIPHLFERFYRGKDAREGGIGIGLSLAKAIIESQNGTVCAKNLPAGGACFEIRFYSH